MNRNNNFIIMNEQYLNSLKLRFPTNRLLIDGEGLETYQECFQITDESKNKDLYPILFYSLQDGTDYDEVIFSMVRVMWDYEKQVKESWISDYTLRAVSVIYPHGILNYSMVLGNLIENRFNEVRECLDKVELDIKNKVIEIIRFILNDKTLIRGDSESKKCKEMLNYLTLQ